MFECSNFPADLIIKQPVAYYNRSCQKTMESSYGSVTINGAISVYMKIHEHLDQCCFEHHIKVCRYTFKLLPPFFFLK